MQASSTEHAQGEKDKASLDADYPYGLGWLNIIKISLRMSNKINY